MTYVRGRDVVGVEVSTPWNSSGGSASVVER